MELVGFHGHFYGVSISLLPSLCLYISLLSFFPSPSLSILFVSRLVFFFSFCFFLLSLYIYLFLLSLYIFFFLLSLYISFLLLSLYFSVFYSCLWIYSLFSFSFSLLSSPSLCLYRCNCLCFSRSVY